MRGYIVFIEFIDGEHSTLEVCATGITNAIENALDMLSGTMRDCVKRISAKKTKG